MKNFTLLLVGLFWLTTSLLGQQVAKSLTYNGTFIGFYEYTPSNHNKFGPKYPLIIFLHGWDERGNGTTDLPLVLRHGPPMMIKGGNTMEYKNPSGQTETFLVLSPQLSPFLGTWTNDHIDAMVNHAINNLNADPNRLYLTGLSMGGAGTWGYPNTSQLHAQKFAAIAPIVSPCWYGEMKTIKTNVGSAPIGVWAFTNRTDEVLGNNWCTIAPCEELKGTQAKVKLTIFPEDGHNAWSQAYNPTYQEEGKNMYEWFLSHVKGATPPPPGNTPPTANAGADVIITSTSVTLDGSGSRDAEGALTYKWSASGPNTPTFSSDAVYNPNVTNLVPGVYTFTLKVTDNQGLTASDVVTVTVNKPPVAKAGNDLSITLPVTSAQLNGTATDEDGSINSISWSQVSGPNEATFDSKSSTNPKVSNLVQGTYTFRLTVKDNHGATATSDVKLTVNPNPNTTPPSATCAAMQFDGFDDWVDIEDISIPKDFTFEAWVKLNHSGTSWDVVAGSAAPVMNFNFFYNKFRLYVQGLGDLFEADTVNVPGVWTHYAFVRQGTVLSIYINGKLRVQADKGWGDPFALQTLGKSYRALNGYLDEVRVWNKARTEAEIKASFNQSIDGSTPGLVAYYKFNEPIDDQGVINSVSGAVSGTRGGSATTTEGDPDRVTSNLPPVTGNCTIAPAATFITRRLDPVVESNIGISVYPNPVRETASIRVTAELPGLYTIRVADASGKVVYSRQTYVLPSTVSTHAVHLPVLATGIYHVQVIGGKDLKTVKLLKIK